MGIESNLTMLNISQVLILEIFSPEVRTIAISNPNSICCTYSDNKCYCIKGMKQTFYDYDYLQISQ